MEIEYPVLNEEKEIRAEDVYGMFKTVNVVPTQTPSNWLDQIVLVMTASNPKLYFYDVTNHVWRQIWTGNIVGSGATSVTQNTTTITISS